MGSASCSGDYPLGSQVQFSSLQDIQNEQPYANLSNKINLSFKRSILASKNLMVINNKSIKESSCHRDNKLEMAFLPNVDMEKITDSLNRKMFLPIFQVFLRMKVKRPVFQMIQIDPRKFLRLKDNYITQDYDILNEIGKGGYGSVFMAMNKNSKEIRAVKKINKLALDDQSKHNLINEFEILGRLDHPNIIKLYDIYDDEQYFYVVTELCEGGNLLNFVNQNRITEKMMRDIMTQLINAVRYMHSFNILHRDIKLENIVLLKKVTNVNERIEIKLIDFGISVDLNKPLDPSQLQPMGTLLYMSPESINSEIGLPMDIWSCGIALYMLAARKMPYVYKTQEQLFHKVEKGEIIKRNLLNLANDLKVLIIQLLNKNWKFRITAGKAITDPWIKKQAHKSSITHSKRLKTAQNLLDYDAKNNLVSIIEYYLIFKKTSQEQRQRLASIFQEIDEDKSGIIQIGELKKFYSENSQNYDSDEVQELLNVMDKNKSGKIDFNEFIAAMYSRRQLFQLQSLEQAFQFFDKDKSGQISKKQLQIILQGVQNEQIEYLFAALDKNKDENISKKQFLNYLSNYEQL